MDDSRVLVVEDDEEIRRLVSTVLGDRGYDVAEAADGESALPAARVARPDVILLDVGLPGMDGFGVLAQLKASELAEVPVLMVTAWAEPELIAKALDRGAHDYVRKPFDISELGARVDAAARVKARQDGPSSDNERLTVMASVDHLTKLVNRYHLTETLERDVAGGRRTGRPFSLLLLDLDHFEAVNDTYGHPAGDALLRAVSRRLSVRLRRSDLIGRWGGEEFMVIAPDTNLAGAAQLGEHLRAALAERPFDTPPASLRATASVGVAEWDGDTAEALVARADAALHAAKQGGRNAVRTAEGPPPRVRIVA